MDKRMKDLFPLGPNAISSNAITLSPRVNRAKNTERASETLIPSPRVRQNSSRGGKRHSYANSVAASSSEASYRSTRAGNSSFVSLEPPSGAERKSGNVGSTNNKANSKIFENNNSVKSTKKQSTTKHYNIDDDQTSIFGNTKDKKTVDIDSERQNNTDNDLSPEHHHSSSTKLNVIQSTTDTTMHNNSGDNKQTKMPINRFTMPLSAIFALECLFIAAAFAAVISYSGTEVNKTSTNLIRSSIQNSLLYAGSMIKDPYDAIEHLIVEYRYRYQGTAIMDIHDNFPCDDHTLLDIAATDNDTTTNFTILFQPTASFYRDMTTTIESNQMIDIAMVVSRSRDYSQVFMSGNSTSKQYMYDNAPFLPLFWNNTTSYQRHLGSRISQCSVTRTSIYRRAFNQSITTTRLPRLRELGHLDSIPLNDSPVALIRADNHEEIRIVKLALNSFHFDSEPIYHDGSDIVLDSDGKRVDTTGEGEGAGVFMLYSTPISYTFWNTTAGKLVELFEAEVQLGTILHLPEVVNPQITSALAFGCSMSEMYPILVSITPYGDPTAHTTIYDLVYGFVMASSGLPDGQGQYNTHDGNTSKTPALYKSGQTPSESINNAFFESQVSLQTGVAAPRVDFEKNAENRIISSFVFQLAYSGNTYGIVQSTSRHYYFGNVSRLITVMITLGALCCVAVVLVCISIAFMIHLGIDQLLANMNLAAQMKNDRTTNITTFLQDVDRLAKGFGKMNERLLEARAYLPQHMLLSSSSEEEDEEGDIRDSSGCDRSRSTARRSDEDSASAVTSETRSQSFDINNKYKNANDTSQTNTYTTATNTTENQSSEVRGRRTNSNSNEAKMQQSRARPQIPLAAGGLVVKRVTILSFNLRGFHKNFSTTGPSSAIAPSTRVAEIVSSISTSYRGVIDSFHGDHFVLSFNVAKPNAEGPQKAARCALELMRYSLPPALNEHLSSSKGAILPAYNTRSKEGINTTNFILNNDSKKDLFQQCAMGIATGRAVVGNLGTSSLKRLSVIGPVYSKAMALGNVCRRFNVNVPSETLVLLQQQQQQQQRRRASDGNTDNSRYYQILESISVQCLVDKAMAAEIEHSFTLQVLGGIFGAPFTPIVTCLERKRETGENVIEVPKSVTRMPVEAGDVSQQHSGTDVNPAKTLPVTVGNNHSNKQMNESDSTPPELLYALRLSVDDNKRENHGDEWLYEISANRSKHLADMNRVMAEYVSDIPRAQIRTRVNSSDSEHDDDDNDDFENLRAKSVYVDALSRLWLYVNETRESYQNSQECLKNSRQIRNKGNPQTPQSDASQKLNSDARTCILPTKNSESTCGLKENERTGNPSTVAYDGVQAFIVDADVKNNHLENEENKYDEEQDEVNGECRLIDHDLALFEAALAYCEFLCKVDLRRLKRMRLPPDVVSTSKEAHSDFSNPQTKTLARVKAVCTCMHELHFSRIFELQPKDTPRGLFFTGLD